MTTGQTTEQPETRVSDRTDCSPLPHALRLVDHELNCFSETHSAVIVAKAYFVLLEELRRCHDWLANEWQHSADDPCSLTREQLMYEANAVIVNQ